MARYDLPKAAPEPLRRVQLLVNSIDVENQREWLPDWLTERGLDAGELERGRALREALRALVLANNGIRLDSAQIDAFNAAAKRVQPEVDRDGEVRFASSGDALDHVAAVALGAMVDGSWSRLKACRNCRWCFYDESPNRSARWCSMQLCGNRKKTRAYRARLRANI
jgi:predicted RNA-binding Zn ribbon-like protein